MTNSFVQGLDRQLWDYTAVSPAAHAAGVCMCCDLRNDASANPNIGIITSATQMYTYNKVQKSFRSAGSPALAGTFGAGTGAVFAPSFSLLGTVGSGSTTTSIVLSAATVNGSAIAAVGTNNFANKGDGVGFLVRVIGSNTGSSGKVEERYIVGNTATATPTIYLDVALSFSPISGDKIEILSGRFFGLNAGTLAAGSFKSYELASNTLSTLGRTNLPSSVSTDFAGVALDELYVPYDRKPGEGFIVGAGTYDAGASKNCLTATATAAGTITGQASAGDAAVLTNEYRNFQIRIVEDTGTPTAVNQRRIIASHTAGASPVYTLGSNWTVQPSATAKYVIEYPNLLFIRSSGTTSVYTYNYGSATINNGTNTIASDAWHATYFGVSGSAMAAGCMLFPSFGIEPDIGKGARHSYIYCFRGGGSTALDLFDIAGGTTGAWSNAITYDGNNQAINTGSCGAYSPYCCSGMYGYINFYVAGATNQMLRFDVKNRSLYPFAATEFIQTGTAAVGGRIANFLIINGSEKYTGILMMLHLSTIMMEIVPQVP